MKAGSAVASFAALAIMAVLCEASQHNLMKIQPFTGSSMSDLMRRSQPLRLRGGEGLLEQIRTSIVEAAGSASSHASINETALEEFAQELKPSKIKRAAKLRFQLPLKYDDLEQEINFHALRGALAFGSGWQQVSTPKHGDKGVPHRDTAVHGLMTLHMEGLKLNADQLRDFPHFSAGQAFGIPLTKEERLDGGPIRQDVPSDYRSHIDRIHNTLVQVSSDLIARGFKSMSDFCLNTQMQGHVRSEEPEDESLFTAELLTRRLAACFECFKDEDHIDNTTVLFHRKAQMLAEDLFVRFGDREERLNFTDVNKLTAGSDAEVVMMLRKRGIINVEPVLADRISRGRQIYAHAPTEVSLRVAGALACTKIAERMNELYPDEQVSNVEVFRYVDLLCKDHYYKALKKVEEEEYNKKGIAEEDRIVEIPDEAISTGLDSDVGPEIPLHITRDTWHY